MAHFAEINENNIVLRVLVTDNNDPNGDEGYQWLIDTLGGRWLKTSYNTYSGVHTLGNTSLRMNFAIVGGRYDEALDAFVPPKPEAIQVENGKSLHWTFNEQTCNWKLDNKAF